MLVCPFTANRLPSTDTGRRCRGWDLFGAISQALGDDLPIIAEDLGIITDEVNALREHFGFPGMKVLQFAFDSTDENAYLPHRFESPVCVCYTGTHDNATTLSWYETLPEHCRKKVCAYTGTTDEKNIGYGLIKAALSSIATLCNLSAAGSFILRR